MMIFLLLIYCYSSECNSMNINVGCLSGRRIEQFEPVTITVYPFNFDESNEKSSFYYDFGDGSNLVTDDLYVQHVYHSSGEFILRVVRTDTATNISSDGSIDCYTQTIIYVFPHDSQYMFQLLSQDEIQNGQIDNHQFNMHVIEIPMGKSTWYLRLIETTNTYIGNFIQNINANLGRYSYMPIITTENEDLLHTIRYNQQFNSYEIEFNYIGTGMQSFTLKFNFNISIGSLLPLSTEYIATTKIIKFDDTLQKGNLNLQNVKPIPYFPSGAVALNALNHPVITNNNFYDWTEMNEVVDDICASSSRVYFVKNGLIYYHELNSDEIKRTISPNNVIRGINITEYDNFKLFGSPRSSFRKAETIDAPDQILLFINSTLYRIIGNDQNIPNNYTKIEFENMTNILFASAYLDPHVTVIIYEYDKQFYRLKIDTLENKTETQAIKIDNLSNVFMHDFTKKMIFINDSYIFLSSDLGISMEIVYLLQDDEKVINYASSLGFDEVIVYTSAGRAIMISPELGIATVLFTLPLRSLEEIPVFIYNYDDSLFVHNNDLTLRIPAESFIKVLTYSLPGGNSAQLWLEKDYGDTLQFSILTSSEKEINSIVNKSSNSHYPPGYLPLDSSKYDLNHLSLYGTTEECRFISGSSRCEVLAFDSVLKQILSGGSTWALSENSGKAQMHINSMYFDRSMIGVTISIPTIKLIFIIDEILSSSDVIGTISLDPDNFELTTRESPRRFDFFRAIDIRSRIEYNSNNYTLKVTDTTSEGQKIILNDIDSDSQIYFNSSMIGMSLLFGSDTDKDLYFPILRVIDYDAAIVIRKKNNPRFLRETTYSDWKITYDQSLNTNSFFRKSWSLRYSWCEPVSDPSFYYPIYSIRSMDSCRFDLNISSYSNMNTRIISNEHFSTISTVSPNNLSLSFTTPKQNYSLSSFVLSIRDSSPQCKHTYLLGISKMCSSNIRFIVNFDNLEMIPIPKVNYRTPSEYGMMISTSPYVYNVNLDIHEYNYKDKLKISQGNFNPSACSSSSKDINDMIESATNCLTRAYKVGYGVPIPVKFALQEYRIIEWESYNNNFTISVKEVNGRKDLCIASKCQVNEREMKYDEEFLVTGKELYHFKFTVNITGCLYTKYAVFWCEQRLLSKSYVFLTMAIVLFICVSVLEAIYFSIVYIPPEEKEKMD